MRYTIGFSSLLAGTYELGTIIYVNKYFELHNEDGPAIIEPDGKKAWYIEGRVINHLSSDEDKWLLLKGNPENIEAFPDTCNRKMQKYVINRRPDLITRICKLDPILKETYKHELSLAGIEI
jgi:hypothetical protein